jgi:hypothetical protein
LTHEIITKYKNLETIIETIPGTTRTIGIGILKKEYFNIHQFEKIKDNTQLVVRLFTPYTSVNMLPLKTRIVVD